MLSATLYCLLLRQQKVLGSKVMVSDGLIGHSAALVRKHWPTKILHMHAMFVLRSFYPIGLVSCLVLSLSLFVTRIFDHFLP